MKAPPFRCVVATSVNGALEALAEDEEATLIAGGQSLVPMLALRLAYPTVLVDLNRVAELRGIARTPDGGMRIGAMIRQSELLSWPDLEAANPLVAATIPYVAHESIRNRGTVGGSLAHADPAAEWPMLAIALDATLELASPEGSRTIPARDFFVGPFTTALPEGHLLRSVEIPAMQPELGWGIYEVARRQGDFALAGAVALISLEDEMIERATVVLMGTTGTPTILDDVQEGLAGVQSDAFQDLLLDAMPASDAFYGHAQASPELQQHLSRVVVRRALDQAVTRARAAHDA